MTGANMRNKILRAAVIPVLFIMAGMHVRRRKARYHPLTSNGQVSSQTETRDRIVGARVLVQRVSPTNPQRQANVSIDPNTTSDIPHKTDAELRRDAEALEQLLVDRYGPRAKQWYTVATGQDANGNLYYTVNNVDTDPALRAEAEKLGYNRIHGSDVNHDGQSHAEQVFMNALDEKDKANADGYGDAEPYSSLPVEPLRLSPGKAPCDDTPGNPKSQGCRDRSGDRLVGW